MSDYVVDSTFEEKVHRTWAQLLAEYDVSREAASIAIDSSLTIHRDGWHETYDSNGHRANVNDFHVQIAIPPAHYGFVKGSDQMRSIMERGIQSLLVNRAIPFYDWNGNCELEVCDGDLRFTYVVNLLEVETGWQQVVRELIAKGKAVNNQGRITSKIFERDNRSVLEHNEMLFASQSEIRIAQELEQRGILFFPLPMAIRHDTGNFYQDHREPDFLVCDEGAWGILEVSFHEGRYEKDSEKTAWFKRSGILCVEHYTAERCYNHPGEVVDQFLSVLAQYKKR